MNRFIQRLSLIAGTTVEPQRRPRLRRLVVASAVVSLAAGCTIVPLETEAPSAQSEIEAYVHSIWDDQLVPTAIDEAVEVETLVEAIGADPDRAGDTYGNRPGRGSYSYLAKGAGTVVGAARKGFVLDAGLPPGAPEIVVATGPVIVSTAVRDASPFLDFADFATQLEYAEVATAINARVKEAVIAPQELGEPEEHVGDEVSFVGAFTHDSEDRLLIIPIQLEVTDG